MTKEKLSDFDSLLRPDHAEAAQVMDESAKDFFRKAGIDADKVQVCRLCSNPYPLTEDFYHKDEREPLGFQLACKECRKLESSSTENRRVRAVMHDLEGDVIENLGRAALRDSSKVPSAASLYESIISHFGGADQFAKHFVADYLAAKPGSAIREKMLRGVVNLSVSVTKAGMADEDVSKLTDKELQERQAEIERQLGQRVMAQLRVVSEESQEGLNAEAS